ncbi:OsmC family protein [Mycolicibacterium sarraceniae]|uniref:Organic hydroperoxide resistance protein n=1 Tax=Mycolicibacterium sarraceniae TaxID=1534348 RepID=A0A7I7SMV3_9MYCO|nr:hypothetical protein MSAR_12340 [Mycolicibacterium sarraceniae]
MKIEVIYTAESTASGGGRDGVEQAQAEELMDKAHRVCPYSKATRGTIDVTLTAKV